MGGVDVPQEGNRQETEKPLDIRNLSPKAWEHQQEQLAKEKAAQANAAADIKKEEPILRSMEKELEPEKTKADQTEKKAKQKSEGIPEAVKKAWKRIVEILSKSFGIKSESTDYDVDEDVDTGETIGGKNHSIEDLLNDKNARQDLATLVLDNDPNLDLVKKYNESKRCAWYVSEVLGLSPIEPNAQRLFQKLADENGGNVKKSLSEVKVGDVVFFKGTYDSPRTITHTGVIINEGPPPQMRHSPTKDRGVVVATLGSEKYGRGEFYAAVTPMRKKPEAPLVAENNAEEKKKEEIKS